jgi:hypothetical protein
MSANNALQAALIARLRGYAPLAAELPVFAGVPAVFFDVPQTFNDTQPYVVVYELPMNDASTDNTTDYECVLNIHVWVQERTTAKTGAIQQHIFDALNRYDELAVIGYTVSGIQSEFSTILRDPDGVTKHGVQRFRINFELAVTYPPCT